MNMDNRIKSFDPTEKNPLASKILGDMPPKFNELDRKLSMLSKFCDYNRITVDDILTLLLKQVHEDLFTNEVEKSHDVTDIPSIIMKSTLLRKITMTTYEQTLILVNEMAKDTNTDFNDIAPFVYISMAHCCSHDISRNRLDDVFKSALHEFNEYSNTDELFR